MSRSLFSWVFTQVAGVLDRRVGWHRLPLPLGIATLIGLRTRLRNRNLHDTSSSAPRLVRTREPSELLPEQPVSEDTRRLTARTADGTFNDLENPAMGSTKTRFGRNVPLERTYPETDLDILE